MSGDEELPQLAPGVRVVRRGRDHLQVGARPSCRVVLRRSEAVTRVLAGLALPRWAPPAPPLDGEARRVLDRLLAAGCAVRRPPGRPRPTRVAVLGPTPGWDDGADVLPLLRGAGLVPVGATAEADLGLVVHLGELDRDRLDPWLRRGLPHLVVRLLDGGAVLGPFVLPGQTPCLRCVDAHLADRDPDHLAVTARYARATARAREDGRADLAEPALVGLALAGAVRDLAAQAAGRAPTTRGHTVELDPDPARSTRTAWTRHPRCGCSWAAVSGASGRMEGMPPLPPPQAP